MSESRGLEQPRPFLSPLFTGVPEKEILRSWVRQREGFSAAPRPQSSALCWPPLQGAEECLGGPN
jgi:hypothetical protein